MNILKYVKIKGDIFSEYAFLSYVLFFESSVSTKADYSFVLPKESLISSVRLFYNNKIIETKIASASHTAMALDSDDGFLTLRKVRNDEYILTIDNIDEKGLTLMLSVYAPLTEDRLSLPLAKKGAGTAVASHTAEIELNVLSASNISSPTHEINISDSKKVTTGKISADRDFALDLKDTPKVSSGILQESITGGEALIKLYPEKFALPDKNLLFIYDKDNISSKAVSNMARDFIFHSAKNYKGAFAVSVSDKLLTDSFVTATDDVLSDLLNKLSTLDADGKSISDLPEDTVAILLTEDAHSTCNIKRQYTITFGSASLSGYHIYPTENITSRADSITEDILYCEKFKNCLAKISSGEATFVDSSSENGITLYIKYTGAFPEKVCLLADGEKEEFPLVNIKAYDSFSPISLTCAKTKQNLLYKKLRHCSPDEVSSIRKELEDIGLKYSVLNSETSLIASLDKKSAPVRVIIPGQAEAYAENTISMFKEDTEAPDRDFIHLCIDYIIKNIRGDGAICTDGEINQDIRKKLSMVCLAALVIASKTEYTKQTEDYLSFKFNDKNQAREYLSSIFEHNDMVFARVSLDLLTAAKVILSI